MQGGNEETMTQVNNENGKFVRVRFPPQAGGGELVLRVLTAGAVDAVLELENTKPIDLVAELAVAALVSINGEKVGGGNDGLEKLRSMSGLRRNFVLGAYGRYHNTSDEEGKALRASIEHVGVDLVQFTVPGTQQRDEKTGRKVEGSGTKFVMRELLAGEIDDVLRSAMQGRSKVTSTNLLVCSSLQSFDGAEIPRGEGGLAWLKAQSNKRRTMIAEAYALLHTPTDDELAPFLDGAEILDAPPKSI